MDNVLIGRFFGPASLGLYSRASALLMRPIEQFLGPVNAVFVPTLSRLQSQPNRYRTTFLRLYEAVALIGFLFHWLISGAGPPVDTCVAGTQLGAGGHHFWRVHHLRHLAFQLQARRLGCLQVKGAAVICWLQGRSTLLSPLFRSLLGCPSDRWE